MFKGCFANNVLEKQGVILTVYQTIYGFGGT